MDTPRNLGMIIQYVKNVTHTHHPAACLFESFGYELIARGLCVENAASVLQAADSYQVLSLRATTIDFMVSNFGAVVQSEAFKDLVKLESRGLVLRFLEEASVRLQPRED